MNRIDWVILSRLSSRIGLTLLVFFGLFSLIESLDTWRFQTLSGIGGPPLAILSLAAGASASTIGTLPVTMLIGAIMGVLDLQARREFLIIKATGTSIWRIMRAPLVATFLFGLLTAFVSEPIVLMAARSLPIPSRSSPTMWLEQTGSDGPYVLYAQHPHSDGQELEGVTVFMTEGLRDRIEAPVARLAAGAWTLDNAVRYRPDFPRQPLASLTLATTTTPGDMRIRMRAARDLTFTELTTALGQHMADPGLRAAALTSFFRLLALPATLVGSVLIAFAFTAGYRRTNKYGGAVLYGVVLGFVVYVVMELANRSGSAGVLDPAFAAAGPAIVAIVIGLTVLLYREDGRA
jgi:lipopolysaccharide export system permease protein